MVLDLTEALSRRKPKLLLVDDQPVNIRLLHQLFREDYELFMANQGEKALELIQEIQPDLVLLDVLMPEMDGLEVCRRMKAEPMMADIPVIFVTAEQSMQGEDACWLAGGADFVSKPYNPRTLKHRVKAHVTAKLQADLLKNLAFLDGLTGIANRRYFDKHAQLVWRQCLRNQSFFGLALVDVDFFKKYNDNVGHLAGDECLKRVAKCLNQSLNRPWDLAARYGGEEFACILPETDPEGVLLLCTELEKRVRKLMIPHPDSFLAVVSVSIGCSAWVPQKNETLEMLVHHVDQALYQAKQAGRSQVVFSPRSYLN